jgi:hypothetical protein
MGIRASLVDARNLQNRIARGCEMEGGLEGSKKGRMDKARHEYIPEVELG